MNKNVRTTAAILNTLPAQVAVLDSHGVIVSVNRAWKGFSKKNALQGSDFSVGKNYVEICEDAVGECSEEARAVALGIRRVLKGDASDFSIDYPCHSPTERLWFRLIVTPLSENADVGAVVMHIEITERKRAEKALQESELQFRTLVEQAPVAISVSRDGIGMYANQKFLQTFGLRSTEEFIGQPLCEHYAPQCQEEIKERIQRRSLGLAVPDEYESIGLRADGSMFPMRVAVSRVELSDGMANLGFITDLTELKKTQQEAADDRARFKFIFESVPVGISLDNLLSDGSKIRLINDAHLRICGITREQEREGGGKLWERLNRPEDFERQTLLLRQLEEGKIDRFSFDKCYIRLTGEVVWVNISILRRRCDDGSFEHLTTVVDITERKRAESELKLFRELIDRSSNGILVVEPSTARFLDINESACRDFGYTREEMLALTVFDVTVELDHAVFDAQVEQLKKAGHALVEHLHRRKDGTTFLGEVNLSFVSLDREYLVVNIRDITERKQAELALVRSESRHRLLFENMLEGYAYCRIIYEQGQARDFVYLEVNDAFGALTGLKNVVGKKASEVIPGIRESNPQLFEVYGRVALTGEPERYETFVQPLSIWFSISVYSHEKEHFTAVFENVTERKRVEAQLRLQSSALEAAANSIVITDSKGIVEWANAAFTTSTGYSVPEAIGKNPRLLKSGKQDEKFYQNLWKTISSGKVWHGEVINRRKDGTLYNEEMTITPIRNPAGEIEHFIAVKQDITERKKSEAQFLRAQRMESVGVLAGGIAHDLNNILAPIVMSIDVLKLTTTDPQAKLVLESIDVSAKRGADIVRQVLSFARGEQGERVEIQPKHLLKDLEKMIKDTFPKDIRLQFSFPKDTWTVLGDPTQVHQVLLNLCVNARDAMPQGGSLTVGIENCVLDEQYAAMNKQAKPGRYVNITVADSGTGMPPDILDNIFEPFFTTKEPGKGTGLGLSTVMSIVKNHDGIINVYSEPGKGTTFKVYLPVAELTAEERKYQTAPISLPRGKGEVVLVIDDEASILTITSQTLQAFGYRVLTATDGADAVAVYAQHQHEIAVVLTDMMMPVMDGSAMIHALMQISPEVKIIAVSGLNAIGSAAKAAGAGVKQFLTKPYTASSLLKTLRTVLDEA
ncbi:MAG: PAS domain S-box protein [Methylacidiphilales bacterium]|nr:PAS domain S-box protein [Candidatus Methylacidiphilales bacterium]